MRFEGLLVPAVKVSSIRNTVHFSVDVSKTAPCHDRESGCLQRTCAVKMETSGIFKVVFSCYQTVRYYIPAESNYFDSSCVTEAGP